jgi:hypothetical protein
MVGATGLEHPAKTPVKPQNPGTRGTKSGTLTDVADLAARLAELSPDVRAALAKALGSK